MSKQHAIGTGHCPQCGHTWGGMKSEHCTASGLKCFALWPTSETGADLNPPTLEETPNSGGIGTQGFSDEFGPVSEKIEALGFLPIDSLEPGSGKGATPVLRMMSLMFLGGQEAKIARIVVGSTSIDVMDVVSAFRIDDQAMLVCFDVLITDVPAKSDVPLSADIPGRRERRCFLAATERPNLLRVGQKPFIPAGITPPTLPSGVGDNGLTVDADDVHALSIQWSCHETFTGNTAGEAHRKGEYPDRTCSTEGLFWNEKRQMWGTTEPGTMPKFWEKDDTPEPEPVAVKPMPVSFGDSPW